MIDYKELSYLELMPSELITNPKCSLEWPEMAICWHLLIIFTATQCLVMSIKQMII